MKKVIVLFALLTAQFVVASGVDLYRGLLFWIKDQKNIEGNESRQTSLPLSTVLDGSKAITFSGANIPIRDTSAFSFAISFKVGSLNCVNRLFQLGRLSRHFYFDAENALHYDYTGCLRTVNWKAGNANTWYTIVVSHEAGANSAGQLKIYVGEKNSKLVKIHSQLEDAFFDCNNKQSFNASFKLGQTDYPTSGYLTSGQFANVRFWTRALTDEECEMADKSQNVFLETKPLGCPSGVKYDFFPLGGNMFGVNESSTTPQCAVYNVTNVGWCVDAGRLSSTGYAMLSDGSGRIVYDDFSQLFGTTIFSSEWVNIPNGNEYYYGRRWEPSFTPYLADGAIKDASYVFWLRIDELPTSGSHTIISRNVVEKLKSRFPNDQELCLKINQDGKLILRLNGADTVFTGARLRSGAWALISIIGRAEKSISVMVNKT